MAAAVIGCHAAADVKLPQIFSDNMVLQRNAAVPVWGTAEPGEKVTVSFAGQTQSVKTGDDGKWMVTLSPMSAAGEGRTMTVCGNNKLTRNNILVGEVWLCSGQSNMEWWLQKSLNGKEEVSRASNPMIRHFSLPYVFKIAPQDDVKPEAVWQVCAPDNIGKFSGVAYFFGKELQKKLNVPVGLIDASWGGTRIEPWISADGFLSMPSLRRNSDRVQAVTPGSELNIRLTKQALTDYEAWLRKAKEAAENGKLLPVPPEYPELLKPRVYHQTPAALYNAMIHPLAPLAIKGVLWYQGCANLVDGMRYKDKMTALLHSFRTAFRNPELPLYFVQLAPFTYGGNDPQALPRFWEAQQKFAESDPYAGMAVINDAGNIRDIHPRNKHTVGHRLALLAFSKSYGMKDIKALSPVYDSFKVQDSQMILSFRNAESLKTRDGKAPSHFEIAGADGVFHPANAVISGSSIILSSADVEKPAFARYAWHQQAEPNVRNEAGLQLGAFRTGTASETALVNSLVPESGRFEAVYRLNPLAPKANAEKVTYQLDRRHELAGKKLKRVAYFLYLVKKDGAREYVYVSMDPFTQDLSRIGVPTFESKAKFQCPVKNLNIFSNSAGVKTGTFASGNIEFWSQDYNPANAAQVPGASAKVFDFGDRYSGNGIGRGKYGSMQIHNTAEKQTVFAYNNWRRNSKCDLGIGNAPGHNTDWTFAGAKNYAQADMLILVETE